LVREKDELKEVARALEETRVQLKEARDRKARILMAISHDLRTPLTSITGYLEAIDDGLAPKKADRDAYLRIIREKSGLLETRIEELIDFARYDTGGWRRHSRPIDVMSLLGRLDAAFRQDAGFAGRTYASQMTLGGGETVVGDDDSLYRAFENLFENALRYTGDGDAIRFTAVSAPPVLTVTMEDNGPGVPESFVPSLFEPFSRADKSRNLPGMGLGLASVRAVVAAHGGTVSYEDNPTGGGRFIVELPLEATPG
jgi:signal transduction histidine kinase